MREYRRAQRRKLPGAGRIFSTKSNTGFWGIHRHERTDQYVAQVSDHGVVRRRKFSILTMGEEMAFLHALAWRLEQLDEIYGLRGWDIICAKAKAGSWLRKIRSWKQGPSATRRSRTASEPGA